MKIRQATIDDLALIMQIERECPTAAHWAEQQYRALFTAETGGIRKLALVAEAMGDESDRAVLRGFLVARHLAPEWELENIVVATTARRAGIGKRLLERLLDEARETHSHVVFLEVRESNQAARRLYEKLGFIQTGRRKSYYANPLEDAILYSFTLG